MEFVDLARQFRDLTAPELADPELLLALSDARLLDGFGWEELLKSPRVLVLAEAGSGKTAEMREQAGRLRMSGKHAFFVPLEALGQDALADVLSGDDRQLFEAWKADDTAIAWFFLDAVDELKLAQGRLDRALRRVANATDGLLHRVRLIVSCRPSDWRPSVDLATLRAALPTQVASIQQTSPEDVFLSALQARGQHESETADVETRIVDVRIVVLFPMNRRQIEQLATALGVANAAGFLE